MNRYLRLLFVATLAGVFLGILGAVLGIEFAKNVPGTSRFLYGLAWMVYGALLWDVYQKK
jgi:ABC-type uncharacterized transport system permease subunit